MDLSPLRTVSRLLPLWLGWGLIILPRLAAAAEDSVHYQAVQAVFAQHCFDCHAAQDPEGKLVLETYADLSKGGASGPALVRGQSAESLLIKMVEGTFEKDGKKKIMPPGKRPKLSPTEIATLKSWIDAGAPSPGEEPAGPRELVVPNLKPLGPVRRSIQAVAFVPGSKTLDPTGSGLLAVARYGEVELFSPETRSVVRTLSGHRGMVNAVTFSEDGKWLAAGAGQPALSGEVRLWNPADGTLVRIFAGHRDALYAVAISPNNKVLASGSYDQKIKLWELETGRELQTLSAHHGAIFDLAFRPDGKILASASGDRTIKLWDVATGKRIETLSQPLKEQYALAWSPDGKRLAAAGVDNRIRVWEISDTAAETTNPLLLAKFAHEGAILNLAFSPDGKTLLSSAEDRTVKIWDAAQVNERRVLELQPDTAPALTFLEGGNAFAVGRLDGTLELYDDKGKHLPRPAPELRAIEPRGVQTGATGIFRLHGKHLLGVTNVSFSNPGLRAECSNATNAGLLEIKLSASPQLARGGYDVWLAAPGGESGKLKVYVDDLVQVTESTATNVLQLPVSCWGVLDTPGDQDEFSFNGHQNEQVIFDLAIRSLGSKIANGSVTVLNANGVVLAGDRGFDGGDRFLAFTLPADGRYVARVTDLMLGASPDHFYRLSIGVLPYVTGVFPLSVGTNTSAEVFLTGPNLPPNAQARVKTAGPGPVEVPIDAKQFRSQRTFQVLAAEGPQPIETEPNDTAEQAQAITAPGMINGRIGTVGDLDVYRFEARVEQHWILETDAARRGSPIDTRLEVLHSDGRPVARLLLQAVRNTAINFRGVDSNGTGMRLDHYEEMELNEYLYLNGEVMRLFRMPQGPDSDMMMYSSAGKRRAYFGTSAVAHALDETGFIVEPQPLGTKLVPTGLPVFTLHYENDDESERKLGNDSRLGFTAPTNGTYLVRVSDTRGQGGDRFAYRLILREAHPDFTVSLSGANPTVAAGSGQSFSVNVERLDGFEDEVKVEITGLPPGFSVSSPIVIQAGHTEAKGTLFANLDAPKPNATNAVTTRVRAAAKLAGQTVTKEVNSLGTIQLSDKPKLFVGLESNSESAGSAYDPSQISPAPLELTIRPGQSVPAWLKIRRNGHDDLVTFFAENLPHGVIVADIGLNGVLIPKGENERRIFFSADRWVPDQDCLFYMIEQQVGRQTSRPVLLHVRKSGSESKPNSTAAVKPGT